MFYGWRVVGGAFVSQLFIVGFFTYAFSLLVPPVREEFDIGLEQVMYSMTATTFLNLFASPVSGILIDRYSVRWVMAAGGLWFAVGIWLLAQVTSITQFIVVFSVTTSVATSLATSTAASAVISRWFTLNRGKALGIAAVEVLLMTRSSVLGRLS